MANANRPTGATSIKRLDGSPWNGRLNIYSIPSTDGNAYAIGDPVASSGSGSAGGVPAVTLATGGTGNAIRGFIMTMGGTSFPGFYADPTNLNTIIIPATKLTTYYVGVCDDPWILVEMQEDSIGNNLAATDIGSNINLVAGTNNGYVSGWMLDSSTVATGATLQMKLYALSQRADNAIGQYGKWLALVNNHELKVGSTGI